MNKSAYMQIDFAFVVLIFFTFFFIVYTLVHNQSIQNKFELEIKEAKYDSIDICNLLISSPGYPNNWESDINSLTFLGLKNINNISLNINKIVALNQINLGNIISSLDIDGILNIKIIGIGSSTSYLNFENNIENFGVVSSTSCFSSYNGEIVEVIVEVWK